MTTTTKITAALASIVSSCVLLLAPVGADAGASSPSIRVCTGAPGACYELPPATQHRAVLLTFDKSAVTDRVWKGTVGGDIVGTLETHLTDRRVTGSIWHVRFDWVITAGRQSFVADLRGTLNTETGAVVMDGRVVEGYLQGARVHEEGQLIDSSGSHFQGTIRIAGSWR